MKVKSLCGLFLALLPIIFLGCTDHKRVEPKRTVIAGEVHNFSEGTAHVLVVNYCDPLSDERQYAQDLTETDGRFHTEHEYLFPQNVTIRFNNRFLNIFLFPGDSLFVSIDANEINNTIADGVEFSGKNAGLNRELFLWTTYHYSVFDSRFDENASPSVFIESVRQDFNAMKDSIEAYSERKGMSDFMKQWAFIDHKFIAANYLMDYSYPEADNWDIFTDPIFDVFNEDNFQTMYFQYHLSTCMNALVRGNAEISRLFSEKAYAPAIRLTIGELSKKAPEGTVRDVMLFSFLQKGLKEVPELYDSIPEIKTAFSHDYFREMLEKKIAEQLKIEEHLNLSEREKQLEGILYLNGGEVEELPDVKLLNYLSEKYQNKVLYLDVWATWCGPCIEAFKYTPELHKYFRDKDVVFVNLCLESKIENWKTAVVKNSISGENYYLGSNASNLFRAEHNLAGFPSYLLINKKREILNSVPGPKNSESVIESIESYLK